MEIIDTILIERSKSDRKHMHLKIDSDLDVEAIKHLIKLLELSIEFMEKQ